MSANTPGMASCFCLPTKVCVDRRPLSCRKQSCHLLHQACVCVLPVAGTIAVCSCERNDFALLRNIQARFVGWAVLETALRQVAYLGIVKAPLHKNRNNCVHSLPKCCCVSRCSALVLFHFLLSSFLSLPSPPLPISLLPSPSLLQSRWV